MSILTLCALIYIAVDRQSRTATLGRGEFTRFPVEAHNLAEVAGGVATIHSSQIAYVDSVSHGLVDEIHVEPGQRVEVGQVLVTLSNPEVVLDAAAKEAEVVQQINNLLITELTLTQTLANRRQELERLSTDVRQNEARLRRMRALHESGAASLEALELSEDALALAIKLRDENTRAYGAEDRLAKDRLSSLRTTVQRLESVSSLSAAAVDGLSIRSPATGILGVLDVEVGKMINRGVNIGRVDLDGNHYAKADVDEFFASNLEVGGAGFVRVANDKEVPVKIRKIATIVKDGKVEVELDFPQGDMSIGLKPGQTFPLRVDLSRTQTVAAVRIDQPLPFRSGDMQFVQRAGEDLARRKELTLGKRAGSVVEVIGGAELGDVIIVPNDPLDEDVVEIRLEE